MVEKLKVRYPDLAARIQERMKIHGVTKKDIQLQVGVNAEMARRYIAGIAKPRHDKMAKLASLLKYTNPAELEWAAPPAPGAREPDEKYSQLDDDALNVAFAWSALSPARKSMYREAIFRDAAYEEIIPDLHFSIPITASYFKFIGNVRHSWTKLLRQLKMDL